ncbi:MAG: CamS family sex pheromone protein [Kurthia sp.]
MKKFRWISVVLAATMLAGCTSPLSKDSKEVVTPDKTDGDATIIPNTKVDGQYYRTLLPYKESSTRGLIVSNIYSKYDVKEVESGLTRISRKNYDPEKYFFQEGQYLDKEAVSSWLARSNQAEGGLNPSDKGLSAEKRAKEAPVYLAHIVEQNYLTQSAENKVKLSGVSIGLALNSVYYYQKEAYGATYEEPISDAKILEYGKKTANEIVKRMRKMEGLANVPITVGLFKQESRAAIIPGTYITFGEAGEGKKSIGDWKNIKEEYLLFPMSNPTDKYKEINDNFQKFKTNINDYFTNSANIIGTGFYTQDKVQTLKVDIPIKFFGSSEITGFTQYASSEVMKQFPKDLKVEVSITSVNGPEALIVKERNATETYIHLYND